ncbi:MAG: hypothetical protein WCB11_17070, partial [Terriglobales bacterium]|jgi:hypothetical protein
MYPRRAHKTGSESAKGGSAPTTKGERQILPFHFSQWILPDNGLVETKNGAVIRKHLGYGSIDAAHAERLQEFYSAHFNPYLNYHRPCAQADIEIDEKGRQ